jgi:hypothetical protein
MVVALRLHVGDLFLLAHALDLDFQLFHVVWLPDTEVIEDGPGLLETTSLAKSLREISFSTYPHGSQVGSGFATFFGVQSTRGVRTKSSALKVGQKMTDGTGSSVSQPTWDLNRSECASHRYIRTTAPEVSSTQLPLYTKPKDEKFMRDIGSSMRGGVESDQSRSTITRV